MGFFKRLFGRGRAKDEYNVRTEVQESGFFAPTSHVKSPAKYGVTERQAGRKVIVTYGPSSRSKRWVVRKPGLATKNSALTPRPPAGSVEVSEEMNKGVTLRAWKQHDKYIRESQQIQQESLSRLDKH